MYILFQSTTVRFSTSFSTALDRRRLPDLIESWSKKLCSDWSKKLCSDWPKNCQSSFPKICRLLIRFLAENASILFCFTNRSKLLDLFVLCPDTESKYLLTLIFFEKQNIIIVLLFRLKWLERLSELTVVILHNVNV
jgi:hypothetical protein